MLFSMGDSLLDGNLVFDEIGLSDALKAVVMFNHGFLWYKFNDSEDIDKKKKELDKVVVSFFERKFSKSFQGMSLESLLANSNYSKVLEDGIILVVSRYFNRKRINVIFDFNSRTCSLDYYWSCKDQDFFIKEIVTELVKNSLNREINFDGEIVVRDIIVDIEFEDKFPRLDLLSDIIMNDRDLGRCFKLCERYMPRSLKSKYVLHMDVGSGSQVVLFFMKHDTLVVRVNELQDRFLVPEIKERLCLLMKEYKEREAELSSIYDSLLGHSLGGIIKYPGEKLVEIKNLRNEVPALFIAGYSRECSVKPFIVSEERAKELEKEGRRTIRYPRKGVYSRIYVCPIGYYPGLKKNRLPNNKMFEYLPACYITDHSLNPGSNYSRYYYEEDEKRGSGTEMRFVEGVSSGLQSQSEYVLSKEEFGTVPGMLRKILMRDSFDKEILRIGSLRSKSSCLYCIHSYIGESLSESVIINLRKNLTFNPCICLQELWYMELSDILYTIRDPDRFLDPVLYIRALESIYNINIYVFDVIKKHEVKLSIAECPLPYIWEPIEGESIVIFCYRDMPGFPHCEYIKVDEVQSLRLREYKSEYLSLVKGPVLKKPFISSTQGLFQQINEDGKCVGVRTRDNVEQCFWRPLDIPLDKTSEDYIEIKNNIKNREMAYFLCDIISILKGFSHDRIADYIEVVEEEVFFEPFMIRERFENVDEFINYYSRKLPLLFKDSKILVNKKVYLRLLRYINSFNYSRLFSRVIKYKHFTKCENVVVVIRK
jgi:Family of unknown function (DUF5757)